MYMQLGAVFLLDAYCDDAISLYIFTDYYSLIRKYFDNRTYSFEFTDCGRPRGYVIWEESKDNECKTNVVRECAPFEAHLSLSKDCTVIAQKESGVGEFEMERELHLYQSTGYALELLASSKYHRKFVAKNYFWVEINPAFKCRQAQFYIAENGTPTAIVTWAWLSKEVEDDVHTSGRALDEKEWNCGDRLFFNDFIAPFGNVREVLFDLTTRLFPEHIATSLRRCSDGSVSKVNRWTGLNYRKTDTK